MAVAALGMALSLLFCAFLHRLWMVAASYASGQQRLPPQSTLIECVTSGTLKAIACV